VRLWRIGYALAVCFGAAVAGLALLWWVALVLLHHPGLAPSKTITVKDSVGVAQLVFASVAGAGALVALVMAYRRQRVAEVATVVDKERWEATAAHDRTRLLNERFTAIATQLGDGQPAVLLAGVHAMAGLADDWEENRQTCVDVLCAYLRLPYDPDPGEDATPADRAAYRANREVRHTIIRLIRDHLLPDADAAVSWQGLNLDFTGVVFDGGDFAGARFSDGIVRFGGASFVSGEVSFGRAEFSGGTVDFGGAGFSGGTVDFGGAGFSGGTVDFGRAGFSGSKVDFGRAGFSGSKVNFGRARFSGGTVDFGGAGFSGGTVDFVFAGFSGSKVNFGRAKFSGSKVNFGRAEFSGAEVIFSGAAMFPGGIAVFRGGAVFSGGTVDFRNARFSGGTVGFGGARFSGGTVGFGDARFSGGTVDFRGAHGWWSQPPVFDWEDAPPAGVILPVEQTPHLPDIPGS
jgi:uncharacterized protein YjbI with pentapeptide repeats